MRFSTVEIYNLIPLTMVKHDHNIPICTKVPIPVVAKKILYRVFEHVRDYYHINADVADL